MTVEQGDATTAGEIVPRRSVATLVAVHSYCETHGCQKMVLERENHEHTNAGCPICSVEAARKLDPDLRRYYVTLLRGALEPSSITELAEIIRPIRQPATEDERIMIGVLFNGALYGFDLGETIARLLIYEARGRPMPLQLQSYWLYV